uniref:Testis expressed 47 n=1 Tax=Poecilia formosa TaxID=48698 RepID=A0A096M7C0_POEFO
VNMTDWDDFWDAMEDDEERVTLFDVVYGRKSEKVVLQQLTMVAQVPSDAADRTELGARYENLITQLTKQHRLGCGITGLLLIYPTCLLHIIEASEYLLDCFLNELRAMQEQPDCKLLEAKVAFMWHSLEGRQFQQWSYKVLTADQINQNPLFTTLEKVEESVETVVCRVLTQLQELVMHLKTSKELPGAILDNKPELLNPPAVLEQLLDRDELLSPQQYLQMYHSPLNICIDFGKRSFILSLKITFTSI